MFSVTDCRLGVLSNANAILLACFLFSKKEAEQRNKELLEGISPFLLELVEKNGKELLFDKGGCQLVLAVLLKSTGKGNKKRIETRQQ